MCACRWGTAASFSRACRLVTLEALVTVQRYCCCTCSRDSPIQWRPAGRRVPSSGAYIVDL